MWREFRRVLFRSTRNILRTLITLLWPHNILRQQINISRLSEEKPLMSKMVTLQEKEKTYYDLCTGVQRLHTVSIEITQYFL